MTFSDGVAIRTLFGEARGEPLEGQFAVAHVLINRRKDGRWGTTPAAVCLWPMQFSCWNVNDPNRLKMLLLADDAPELITLTQVWEGANADLGPDPVGGAQFYYAASMAQPPSWAKAMTVTAKIGRHTFLIDR